MTDTKPSELFSNSLTVARVALGALGVLAVVFGILMLAVPRGVAVVIAAIIAIYVLITGLVYLSVGIFTKGASGWLRTGQIILGVLFIVASILAFTNLAATAVWLLMFLAIMLGVLWIIEGVASLVTLKEVESKTWTVVFAIISVLAGITLIVSPLWGVAFLWIFTGVSLIVLGIVQIIRAATLSKKVDNFFAV